MAKRDGRVPYEPDLVRLLQCGEAILGRASAYREGGGSSGYGGDHERSVTDRRFSGRESEVGCIRRDLARFSLLCMLHRDALALTYGVAPAILRMHVFEAFNHESWHAVERHLGGLAPLALYLQERATEEPPPSKRWADRARGGPWRSSAALALVAVCLRGDADELGPVQSRATGVLDAALVAWRGPVVEVDEPRERARAQRWSTDYIAPVRCSP